MEGGRAAAESPRPGPNPQYLYFWQRPSAAYKERLRARQAELRALDLEANDELQAEWFALLAEIDDVMRLSRDAAEVRSGRSYTEALLARRAELAQADLDASPALLLEWFMLIHDLDYVARRKAAAEARLVGSAATDTPRAAAMAAAPVGAHEGTAVAVPGGTRYAAASRPRSRSAPSQRLENEFDGHAAAECAADLGGALDGAADGGGAATDGCAASPHRSDAVAGAKEAHAGTAAVKDAELAVTMGGLMPRETPSLSPGALGVDDEGTERWIDLLEDAGRAWWRPPSVEDVHSGRLPAWLRDDAEFMRQLCNERPDLGPGDSGTPPDFDPRRPTEAELRRRITDATEEIRQTLARLEVADGKTALERRRAFVEAVPDGEKRADLSMELIDRELELGWQEKELAEGIGLPQAAGARGVDRGSTAPLGLLGGGSEHPFGLQERDRATVAARKPHA